MIKRLSSGLKTFKTLEFNQGLNILLADRSNTSSIGRTRNGAGKSSFIEIVHFVALGASSSDLFKSETLVDHDFEVQFEVQTSTVTIVRAGRDASKVFVRGELAWLPFSLETDKKSRRYLKQNSWRAALADGMFGVSQSDSAGAPTFRTLITYFARRVSTGGIVEPHRIAREQQLGSIQVNLSFLFDLDYELPMALDQLRLKERNLRELSLLQSLVLFPIFSNRRRSFVRSLRILSQESAT